MTRLAPDHSCLLLVLTLGFTLDSVSACCSCFILHPLPTLPVTRLRCCLPFMTDLPVHYRLGSPIPASSFSSLLQFLQSSSASSGTYFMLYIHSLASAKPVCLNPAILLPAVSYSWLLYHGFMSTTCTDYWIDHRHSYPTVLQHLLPHHQWPSSWSSTRGLLLHVRLTNQVSENCTLRR